MPSKNAVLEVWEQFCHLSLKETKHVVKQKVFSGI